jgi:hypothetical protein
LVSWMHCLRVVDWKTSLLQYEPVPCDDQDCKRIDAFA